MPEGTPTVLRHADCYAVLENGVLTVGNDGFTRVWRVDGSGLLHAVSFDETSPGGGRRTEWLATPPPSPPAALPLPEEPRAVALTSCERTSVVEAGSLVACLTAAGARATLRHTLQIFPGVRGVRRATEGDGAADADGGPAAETADGQPTGVETDGAADGPGGADAADRLEALTLTPLHLRLTAVTFRDRTDVHNELVHEQEWLLHPAERPFSLSGNLFIIEDVLNGAGLIFLKEAPLPHARPEPSPADFHVNPAARSVALLGPGYRWVTLAYEGGRAGSTAALQQYQRCLRPYVPARDGLLVSNTWGDRNRDGRINADFLAREVEAGARLGVDVVQVDDGWQAGTTANSVHAKAAGGVWEGFYQAKPDFWAVHPERFPDGLHPLVEAARETGMRFGLWFAPDSTDDFVNHERDADTLLRLHRDLGVDYFKIDGVKLRSRRGEARLDAFFDRVLDGSGGRVVFDTDVTAETRPGYWGLMRVGPVFVENRYTDWRRYWPHQTLRNLWKLAHFVDPLRLRMEWLNHARNAEKYEDDPLAPAAYRPDYLFATVMFSSPLGWFEVSNLPETYFAEAAPLIAVWKRHREAIFAGTVLPLGDAPDGTAWTGFASVAPDRHGAYLLVFREFHAEEEWAVRVPLLSPGRGSVTPGPVERLAGDGAAEWGEGGLLRVRIPERQRFLFVRFTL